MNSVQSDCSSIVVGDQRDVINIRYSLQWRHSGHATTDRATDWIQFHDAAFRIIVDRRFSYERSDYLLTRAATSEGFNLRGGYDVAPAQPKWGWGTDYALNTQMQLTITSHNIDPQGQKSKAIETVYNRELPREGSNQPVGRASNAKLDCKASLRLMLTSER